MRKEDILYVTLNNYPESCNLFRCGILIDYVDGNKLLISAHFGLSLILCGAIRVYFGNGTVQDYKRGDMYISGPGIVHRIEYIEKDTQIFVAEFTKEFLGYNPQGATIKDRLISFLLMDMNMHKSRAIFHKIVMPAEDQSFLAKLVNRLHYEFNRRREGMFEVIHDVLLVILDVVGWKFLYQPSIISVERKYQRLNDILTSSVEYIHEHFQQKIVLDDLVKMFGTSKTVYCTLFKQKYGMTFYDYLTDLRCEKAVRLLIETDLSMDEIAELSGFSDSTVLYRNFMHAYGLSPGKYRKGHREV